MSETTATKKIPVAAIHSHFNIYRNINDVHEGDVTIAEQIVAMERFVRWHERQVAVGRQLLNKLRHTVDVAQNNAGGEVQEPESVGSVF